MSDMEQLKEICFEFEDALMEKGVLVGVAPESMVGVQLQPEFYDSDGSQHVKVNIMVELTGDEAIDEDDAESISDTTSDWLAENGFTEKVDGIGIDPDEVDWYPVKAIKA